MRFRVDLHGTLLVLVLAAGLTAAAAQPHPRLAMIPTQYFSADAESAENVTQGLVRQFERQGYDVLSLDRSRATLRRMELDPHRQYSDPVALAFGRRMGADLVAYPRLMAVGVAAFGKSGVTGEPNRVPASRREVGGSEAATKAGEPRFGREADSGGGRAPGEAAMKGAAVLALRVLNAHTGQPVYFRQVRRSFVGDRPSGQSVTLSPQMADAVAEEATRPYFARVAGSRQEFRRGH
jgi:hypothetical protein